MREKKKLIDPLASIGIRGYDERGEKRGRRREPYGWEKRPLQGETGTCLREPRELATLGNWRRHRI